MDFPLSKIVEVIKAKWPGPLSTISITGISTDSRTVSPGDLFFALSGPTFDGHEFLEEAKEKGAIAAVVDKSRSFKFGEFPLLQVDSPLQALGDLAQWYRQQFDIPLIAITGSSGKTTTKDLLASILSVSQKNLATEGNLNNLIGVPITLFRLNPEIKTAVIEMGMNTRKEIFRLSKIAQPTIGLITNIGHAHLEFLETMEEVAEAKYELWDAMENQGTAIVNLDDERITKIASRWKGKTVTYSNNVEHADILVTVLETGKNGQTKCELCINGEGGIELSIPLIGTHNVYNAAAAAATAHALQTPIEDIREGLSKPQITKMRSELLHFSKERVIINDAYNANPNSMEAALQSLIMMRGTRQAVAILGDMFELGEQSEELHFDIGAFVAELKVDHLVTFGKLSKAIAEGALKYGFPKDRLFSCHELGEVMEVVSPLIHSPDTIFLVKGSRGMAMERIVEKMKKEIKESQED
ncbi:UDP-N-acetylmuramoyl-tripeptide--D-alanyl-D-alanine ligase [Bdellovibrionota bacterium]